MQKQLDLYGKPVPVGKKDPPAVRQYLFPPDVIVAINAIHLKTGRSKPDIVADAVRTYAAAMRSADDIMRDPDVDACIKASLDMAGQILGAFQKLSLPPGLNKV